MIAVALCAVGAEKILSNEIKKIISIYNVPVSVKESFYGKVRFETDIRGIYFALIGLRTADRILLELASYEALDFDALYEGASSIELEKYIKKGTGLVIDKVRTRGSKLFAEKTIQAMVHKALAGRLCSYHKVERLPVSDDFNAQIRVFIDKNKASILLDISGDPLYKRGWRLSGGVAPLRETTAAALMLSTGWKRKYPLYDPFCGSGTIAVEAALYAHNIAPGLARHFSIDNVLIADKKIEGEVRDIYRQGIDLSNIVRINGSDGDNNAVETAKKNVANVCKLYGLDNPPNKKLNPVTFNTVAMSDARAFETDGFIITNPPYGNRLGDKRSAEENYKNMARLKANFPGWKIIVISDNTEFETFFGSKATEKRELSNGADSLYIYRYDAIVSEPHRTCDHETVRRKKGKKHIYTW
jgi:putative N6-adenine-specific DNA methylase